MTESRHLPIIAWRGIVRNVVMLTESTYRIDVMPVDENEPGATGREIGNFFKDYVGHTYLIIDSTSTTIDVEDVFECNIGPQTDQIGIVYQSVGDGDSPYLAPIFYQYLDRSALDYSRAIELSVLYELRFADNILPDTTDFAGLFDETTDTVQKALEILDSHNHDSRYYTETEINNTLSAYETISGAESKYSVLGHAHSYAPVSGSANYIQNQNASAQSANLWIDGIGKFGKLHVTTEDNDYDGLTITNGTTNWNILTGQTGYYNSNLVFLYKASPDWKTIKFDINGNIISDGLAGSGTRLVTASSTGQLGSSTALNFIGNDYIKNQYDSAQTANMWISGSGRFDTNLIGNVVYASNGLNVQAANYPVINFIKSNGTQHATIYSADYSLNLRVYDSGGNYATPLELTKGTASVIGTTGDVFSVTTSIGKYTLNAYTWTTPSSHVVSIGASGYYNVTNGTTNFYLTTTGFGINNTDPQHALDVTGDIGIKGVGQKLYFDSTGARNSHSIGIRDDYDLSFYNSRGQSSEFVLGSASVYLKTASTTRLYFDGATGTATFSSLAGTGTRLVTADANGQLGSSTALNFIGNDYVQTQYNSSLNSDSRNSRGVTRLYRWDNNEDYSVQVNWNNTYWRLLGYNGDTYHAGVSVHHADSAGISSSTNILNNIDNRGADRQPSYYSYGTTGFFNSSIPATGGYWASGITVKGWSDPNYNTWQLIGGSETVSVGKWWFREGISSFGTAYEIWHSGNLTSGLTSMVIPYWNGSKLTDSSMTAITNGFRIANNNRAFDLTFTYSGGANISAEGAPIKLESGWNSTITLTTGSSGYENGSVNIPFGKLGVGITPSYRVDIKDPDSSEVRIGGGSSADFINAAILFQNNGSQSYRGLGTFYLDTAGQHEWYVGTPYAYADSFMIGRRGSATSHSTSTAQRSNSFMRILNDSSILMGTDTPLGNTQLTVNLVSGGGGAAIAARYNNNTTDLGEAAFLAFRNSAWSNLYLSGSGSSTTYGFYVGGTKVNYINSTLGIGYTDPETYRLKVNGTGYFNGKVTATQFQMTTGATDGYFMRSDASGNATWAAIAASNIYKGTWNASTNTPTLANGTGTAGWYYRVTTSGTWNSITFSIGDDIFYNGSTWERVPGQGYSLQTATSSVLGGVKIGSGVSIDGNGAISVSTAYRASSWTPLWSDIQSKPSTIAGFGITDAMTTSHPANGIVSGTGLLRNTAGTWSYDNATYSLASHNHSGVYEPANSNIQSHISSTSNPHSVTAFQVGLGNVENAAASGLYEPKFTKNTGFNKNFGTTAGTVLEGRTFGTAANSATTDFDPAGTAASAISTHNSAYNHANLHTHSNKSTLDLIEAALTTALKVNYDTAYSHSQTAHQTIINGTGFVKASGTTLSYDNATYSLASHNHSGVYDNYQNWGLYINNSTLVSSVTTGLNVFFKEGSGINITETHASGYAHVTISATGAMTYPAAGIAVSTGSAWGTSLTDNSANWNTAYSWGNHASAGYLTSQTSHADVVQDGDFATQGIMLRGASSGNYSILTDNSANWNTAYTDRLKWDGGSTGLTAATGRTSLGGTTIGQAMFTLANPTAVTFPRFNADNTVSALSASDFRTAIGVSTGGMTDPMTTRGDLIYRNSSNVTARLPIGTGGYFLYSNGYDVWWNEVSGRWTTDDYGYYYAGGSVGIGGNSGYYQKLYVYSGLNSTNAIAIQGQAVYGSGGWFSTANGLIGLAGTSAAASGEAIGGYFVAYNSAQGVGVQGKGGKYDIQAAYSGMINMYQISSPTTPSGNTNSIFVKSDNKLYIINSAGTSTVVGDQTSDFWLKKDFRKLETPLEKILKLNAYSFNYQKEPSPFAPKTAISIMLTNDTGKRDASGVIAQEIEKLIPESVYTSENGYKSVNYNQVVPYLIESIKELNGKIETLQNKITSV